MKVSFFVIVLLFGLLLFTALFFFAETKREEGLVTKVIDGDTLELNSSEKVRLLGVNAPEKGEPYYAEAKKRLEQLVLNKTVLMERDDEDRDRYGRMLRYVYIGDEMVNLVLLEEGYATLYVLQPNEAYETLFRNAEEAARASRMGVWSLVSEHECASCIRVEVNWNAKGDDCTNANGEWIAIENLCSFCCNLKGWSLKDAGTAVYTFPDFTLDPKSSVKIFSGRGNSTDRELYWSRKGSCPAVWNNDGDTVYVKDSDGKLVLKQSYEGRE